jgi:hypothetical protein
LTALQLLLELQRDCAWTEHYDEVMAVVAQIGSGETRDRVADQAAIGGLA